MNGPVNVSGFGGSRKQLTFSNNEILNPVKGIIISMMIGLIILLILSVQAKNVTKVDMIIVISVIVLIWIFPGSLIYIFLSSAPIKFIFTQDKIGFVFMLEKQKYQYVDVNKIRMVRINMKTKKLIINANYDLEFRFVSKDILEYITQYSDNHGIEVNNISY